MVRLTVILLGVENAGNLGAIARAMKNFGERDLVLIEPKCDPSSKEAQDRAYLTEDNRAMSWIRRADLGRLIVQALDDSRAIGKTYHAFDPDRTRFWAIPLN